MIQKPMYVSPSLGIQHLSLVPTGQCEACLSPPDRNKSTYALGCRSRVSSPESVPSAHICGGAGAKNTYTVGTEYI